MRFRPYWKLLVLPLCRHLPMPLYEPNWSISGEERRPLLPSCRIVGLSSYCCLRLLCMFSRFFQQQFKATTLEPRDMVCTSSGGIVKTFALSRRQVPWLSKRHTHKSGSLVLVGAGGGFCPRSRYRKPIVWPAIALDVMDMGDTAVQ